ncbi:MAG: riboflavin biosynthesis protein RibF [Candidatus Aminicenantes bacterium]|nr:riboflavin biosynthesis protein RibF [Candidatus Aminicenantes bacterium]
MRVVRGLQAFRPPHGGTAVAIGNFDGVHPGHRRVLRELLRLAQRGGLAPVVLTFSPHPEKALRRSGIPLLQTREQKYSQIARLGLPVLLLVTLTPRLASLSAQKFVRAVLARKLRARAVVVGRGFRFGKDRRGRTADLERLGRLLKIRVRIVAPVKKAGRPVSSSSIRKALLRNDIERVRRLLGRPYEVWGRVVRGKERGRQLGFPTANLRTRNELLPSGIFLTRVVVKGRAYPALTYVGTSPTFGDRPRRLEAYLLGYQGRLYGEKLRVSFLKRLRPERKFAAEQALVAQMKKDLAAARAYFRRRHLRP